MGKAFVYKITNPIGQVYIGSTLNIEKRFRGYKNKGSRCQIKLFNSFSLYGYDSHTLECIWEGDVSIRFLKEREFGLLYNVLDLELGLNSILPKYGAFKTIRSSDINIKISNSLKFKTLSAETKLKVSLNNARFMPSKDTILKAKKSIQRAILQYSINGEFVKEYESTTDAAIENNLKRSAIKNALNGLSKTCYGYIWKYKDGVANRNTRKKVCQIDLNTNNEICIYESISSAARNVGITGNCISDVIKGKYYSAAGFGWKQITN